MTRIFSLPNNKILDWSKLKAFADQKINKTEKLKYVSAKVENIVGKEEKAPYTGSFKVMIVWQRVNSTQKECF